MARCSEAMEVRDADVLILGSGLAGLSAALAAGEIHKGRPGPGVLVVGGAPGPDGSSFAIVNDRLGVAAPESSGERNRFVGRALEISGPGEIHEPLVRIMADEARDRVEWLDALDVPMERAKSGEPARHACCFLPGLPMARVLAPLGPLHGILKRRAREVGVSFLAPACVLSLVREQGSPVLGAVVWHAGNVVAIRARAVVLALGGPGSLFGRSVSGPGGTGVGYALLHRAGVSLANVRHVQFVWRRYDGQGFVRPDRLWERGWRCMDGTPLPHVDVSLLAGRREHWPYGNGMADSAVDNVLLSLAGEDRMTRLLSPEGEVVSMGLVAQAGNGGARIDPMGRTGVEGLYACGECASTMHGANRIGGAMALSCLVFGRRAGEDAARICSARADRPGHGAMRELAERSLPGDPFLPVRTMTEGATPREVLDRSAMPGGDTSKADALRVLGSRCRTVLHPLDRLRLESASAMLQAR